MRHLSFLFVGTALAAAAFTASTILRDAGADPPGDQPLPGVLYVGMVVRGHVLAFPTLPPDLTPADPPISLDLRCTSATTHDYVVANNSIESTSRVRQLGHAVATLSVGSEYQGEVPWTAMGPGGWSASGVAQAVGNRADIYVTLPDQPGEVTIEVFYETAVTTVLLTAPGACAPLDMNTWVAPHLNLHFPFVPKMDATASPGSCPGWVDTLEARFQSDGGMEVYQPSTGDRNLGVFWPALGGGYLFLVVNGDHPEGYVGFISPDFTEISGRAVWNNQCTWLFHGVAED